MPADETPSTGSSPYSTGGGGVRLEHSYAACLIIGFLAGEALSELGDSIAVDTIRLQASDSSDVDDIVVEGRDAHGEVHRSSIAVRRSPALTSSDSTSVPLIRDFLAVVTSQWSEASAGRWRVVLAVSTNANAITQVGELAELARSLPGPDALANRLAERGRTNLGLRSRHDHIKALVRQASAGLDSAVGLSVEELTWRLLFTLSTRSLRLERTDRADRTTAVSALRRMLGNGTPAAADALFSRIEELVGEWAPQAAVLTQSVIRRRLSDYPLSSSARFASTWGMIDRLGVRLRESVRPALRSAAQSLELERAVEKGRLVEAMTAVGRSAGALVVTGDPDVGKSALSLRAVEVFKQGAAVCSLSLRDLPPTPAQLESQWGGHAIDEIMAASEVRPIRLLLVDGAESVLEGKGQVFRAIASAALKAGVGVVAVTRTDGSRQVRDELAQAMELARSVGAPGEHVVGPLTGDERYALASTFTTLSRLGSDIRASWLLGRPGLVDALLRTGAALDPADLLCEADVFAAVWRSLVRRDEVHLPGTASPDDREQAALSVARRSLGIDATPVQGTGSAELRSDGVLRVPNNPAFSAGDEFATDLFRDFALCRLFITHGWGPLAEAGAPRWSIRAARLGCQTALLDRRNEAGWATLSARFGEIAGVQGERWLEVPYEALLTLGDADSAIRELWAALTDDGCSALLRLLRLAETRYVNGTIGDAFALAPLVKVAFCERPTIEGGRRLGRRGVDEIVRDLVLAWLRGMASTQRQPDPLRQNVRDVILDNDPLLYDDFAVEALASLGTDTNDRAEAYLRAVADERPGNLNPAVESAVVAISMSQARPKLLLDLAEAYYIENPRPRGMWGGSVDDGIRDFRHGLKPGFGVPQAAWFYGPFFRLLNTVPVDAIGFINRMLDHAAKVRVGTLSTLRGRAGEPEDLQGVHLDLPGIGRRLYVGDSHVWAWYRGTSVGPRACMSALLALERFIDDLLERLDCPVQTILDRLLENCHNLAVPGLVVGFLTRHPDAAGALLDPYLASPAVWHLEHARIAGDYGIRLRDADADKLTGSDRRLYMVQQIVGELVIKARLADDHERLAQLEGIGAKLVEAARAELTYVDGENSDYLAVVESWAEHFRVENYQASRAGDHLVIEFERPERIEQVLAPRSAELQTTNTLYGLQNRYGRHNDDPASWPVDKLDDDLATARRIAENEHAPAGMVSPENALVAVAAAAVRAHAMDLARLDSSSVTWAVEAVIWAAENPAVDGMSYHETTFPMAADRAAAASAPLLLLEAFNELELDRPQVENVLRSLATSLFDEVRAIYVKGCEPVWAAPCDMDEDSNRCRRHEPAWAAATAGLSDSKLGSWNEDAGERESDPLPLPFHDSLPAVADDELLVNRLRMPLACMVDARRVPCLQDAIRDLWAPLWDAHRRGLLHWWKEGYDHHSHITHEPMARRMVAIAIDGDPGPVAAHIAAFAADSNALHMLFDGFATVFTYDEELRSSMADFWPWALEAALDAVGDGTELRSQHHWFDYMTAALLPTPSPRSWDPKIDTTLTRCRENWIQPEDLGPLPDRWLQLARYEPKAVDAVIKFAKSAPLHWQTTTALTWIETIIDGRYDLIANHLWLLEEWLTELRNRGVAAEHTRSCYHRVVDGLAAAGDRAAVRLQQLDE